MIDIIHIDELKETIATGLQRFQASHADRKPLDANALAEYKELLSREMQSYTVAEVEAAYTAQLKQSSYFPSLSEIMKHLPEDGTYRQGGGSGGFYGKDQYGNFIESDKYYPYVFMTFSTRIEWYFFCHQMFRERPGDVGEINRRREYYGRQVIEPVSPDQMQREMQRFAAERQDATAWQAVGQQTIRKVVS